MTRHPSVSSRAPRMALAFALLLALSACGGGGASVPTAPSPSEPASSEPIASEEVESPSAGEATGAASPSSSEASSAVPDNGTGRPASVTLVISGTSDSDGSYSSSAPARYCGDEAFFFTLNLRAFNFEFPLSGKPEIEDVTFGADDLVPGSTTAVFHVGVSVHTKSGIEAPSTVVQPGMSGSHDTGSASLSESGGTTTLVVQGSDDIGQTVQMTVTCGPR